MATFFIPQTNSNVTPSSSVVSQGLLPYTLTGGIFSTIEVGVVTNDPGPALVGGLNVCVFPSAGGAGWRSPVTANTGLTLGFPVEYAGSFERLIGVGWEVVNTSPTVFQGGSVTTYKCPQGMTDTDLLFKNETNLTINNIKGRISCLPPATQSQAALYPNSQTWSAVEGLYQIGTLSSVDNPFQSLQPMLLGYSDPLLPGNGTTKQFWLPTITNGSISSQPIQLDCRQYCHSLPFDVSGAHFAGFASDQQFQVTVKYFIEKIPSITDANLVVLTQPASPYDPLALELYARATSILPVACTVNENPLGEWFESLMDVLSSVAPAIGTALTPLMPIAGAVGAGLGGLAKGAANTNRQARLGKGNSPPRGGVRTTNESKKTLQPRTSVTVKNGNDNTQKKKNRNKKKKNS